MFRWFSIPPAPDGMVLRELVNIEYARHFMAPPGDEILVDDVLKQLRIWRNDELKEAARRV